MHDQAWSWVGEDGVEHRGSENQLTDALASGRIPSYTLVTKPEWRDWLPAMTVVELQWALPTGTADNPRRPLPRENLPKLPPPLGDYPIFRQRHQNLLQYAASVPPEMPSSSGRALPKYTSDDYDEPTVQIDAEELERALIESRADDGSLRRGAGSPLARLTNSSAGGQRQSGAPMVNRPINRAALAERLALKMPTHPGYVPNAPGQSSQAPGRGLPSQPQSPPMPQSPAVMSPRSAPISSQPGPLAFDSQPPPGAPPPPFPERYKPIDNSAVFGGHEPTMTSRLDSVLPPSHNPPFGRKGRTALWFLALVVVGAVAGAFIFQTKPLQQAPSAAATTGAEVNLKLPLPVTPTPQLRSCEVGKQVKLSDFAHPPVRPATSNVPGSPRLAIAFAQSGKIATGLTLDPVTLAATAQFSESQNSPVWSVTPTPLGNDLRFQTSRAASTLRSTTTLQAATPLVVGLNRDHIAGRTNSDLVDREIWKSDWDTISSPDSIQLDPSTFILAFRGGGERGKIVLGKLTDAGKPLGPLSPINSPSPRVEAPFITLQDKQILVTFAGGDKPLRDKVLVASSKLDSLPTQANELLTDPEGVTSPQFVPLEGGLALQYTRGAPGKQQVVVQVYSSELRAVSSPFVLSQSGRDAYEGYAFHHGQQAFVLYFARQPLGHELWLATLVCEHS